jgi:hypothetical protein
VAVGSAAAAPPVEAAAAAAPPVEAAAAATVEAAAAAPGRPEPVPAGGLPPGWYPDEARPGLMRYWDGSRWAAQSRSAGRRTGRLALAGLLIVLIGGGGGAAVYLVAFRGHPAHPAAADRGGRPAAAPAASTGGSPSASPTPATSGAPSGGSEATAVNRLLVRSAADRTRLSTAIASLETCSNVDASAATLRSVALSRQQMVTALGSLDLAALPNHGSLRAALGAAWRDSLHSDRAYSAWGADLQSAGCTPASATDDPHYRAAHPYDVAAEAAKARFATLWNPVARQFGLPARTANSF